MYTKEQILKQINELTLAQAKLNSNAKEAIYGLARNDDVLNSVIDDLLPFRKNGESFLVNLGQQIVDNESMQTANNVLNFYVMAYRDAALEFGYKMRWDSEIYKLNLQDIVSAGFEIQGGRCDSY